MWKGTSRSGKDGHGILIVHAAQFFVTMWECIIVRICRGLLTSGCAGSLLTHGDVLSIALSTQTNFYIETSTLSITESMFPMNLVHCTAISLRWLSWICPVILQWYLVTIYFFTFLALKAIDDHCGYRLPFDPLQHISASVGIICIIMTFIIRFMNYHSGSWYP